MVLMRDDDGDVAGSVEIVTRIAWWLILNSIILQILQTLWVERLNFRQIENIAIRLMNYFNYTLTTVMLDISLWLEGISLVFLGA